MTKSNNPNLAFDRVAATQGWDYRSQLALVRDFIGERNLEQELLAFAVDVARQENEDERAPECPLHLVHDASCPLCTAV